MLVVKNCCRGGKLQVVYICGLSISGPDSSHARPTPSVSSTSPSKCRMAQKVDWYSLSLPRDCLSESGHCGSRPSQPVCRSHLVEVPSQAKPANRWNLPIAGVAVQINRVQYFSLSALVREGRPIFVICTQHSAHSRLGRRGRYTARAGLLACSQCARDRMKTHWTRGIDPSSGIRFMLFFGYQLSLLHSLRLVVLPAQYPLRLFSRPEAFVAAQISLDRYIWVVLLCQLFT